jgi:hypothetical protein
MLDWVQVQKMNKGRRVFIIPSSSNRKNSLVAVDAVPGETIYVVEE